MHSVCLHVAIPLSINTLTLLKWKDQHGCMKKFKLITKVSSKWRDFGIRLSHELDQLEAWAEECRGVSSRCWCRVMNYWITENDSPDYPATWSGLFLVLEDVEYSEVAAELKKALASVMPTNAKSRRLLPLSIYAPFNRGSIIKEGPSRSQESPPAPPSPPVRDCYVSYFRGVLFFVVVCFCFFCYTIRAHINCFGSGADPGGGGGGGGGERGEGRGPRTPLPF